MTIVEGMPHTTSSRKVVSEEKERGVCKGEKDDEQEITMVNHRR